MNNKLKIVWICSFSNPEIRSYLDIKPKSIFEKVICKMFNYDIMTNKDSAVWNTNAIEQFEKFHNIDLHIICAYRGLRKEEIKFNIRGINYYFFREENTPFSKRIYNLFFARNTSQYKKNRLHFSKLISEINPDLVHVVGAENPYYSLALLDVPKSIPTIVQLQALLSRIVNVTQNPVEKKSFKYKSVFEQEIIKRANYIGTNVQVFAEYIRNNIKKNAIILKTSLAMAQKIDLTEEKKEFDFVYFSVDIQKAVDDAIEAFVIAYKKNSKITLDIIGKYSSDLKERIINRLKTVGAENSVTFEGLLPTHDDVIKQIRRSRFALLPLKMDIVPNTIHEAMGNGLPVVTTVTEGTPKLNNKRLSVLLSQQGDYLSMAENMIKLLSDEKLSSSLRNNAAITESEYSNNHDRMLEWVNAYYECISNFRYNKPINEKLLMK